MAFSARILADSIGPNNVPRLTTFELTLPRPFLAELNTHRMLSRNSASSRAIPVEKMIERVMTDPYIPMSWGKNQRGMQAEVEVSAEEAQQARDQWLYARDCAVHQAGLLLKIGIHKQLTNRLLEPFLWHTCIVTSTEWSNLFHLRDNKMAQPEMQTITRMIRTLYAENVPETLDYGEWHLPLISADDYAEVFEKGYADVNNSQELFGLLVKVSSGRCARISYLTHEGKRDLMADVQLHNDLLGNGHMSPFEHIARPAQPDDDKNCMTRFDEICRGVDYIHVHPENQWFGNFRGWVQYRKTIPGESDMFANKES